MEELSFVTSNFHKFEEVSNYFKDTKLKINHLKQKYPELQADTFSQIVLSSASILSSTIDQPFILEDSGISISGLNNFPGPYSSYVFQTIGWKGILDLMRDLEYREAHFSSIIALVENDEIKTFEGITKGKISIQGKGEGGFGFDPIFIPNLEGEIGSKNTQTFAQMNLVKKNKISHRAKSMKKLRAYLIDNI